MADQLSSDLASLRIKRGEENPEIKANRRMRVVYAVVGVVLLIAVYIAFQMLGSRVFQTEVDVTEIRMVSPAAASIQVTSTGYVVPQKESAVGAKLLGRVAEVKVKEGDKVKAGDVLVRLEAADQRTAIAASRARALAAKARVLTAKANLAETKRQYERERDLAAQGASARSVAEDLAARVTALEETAKAAQADADASDAELKQLEVNLGDMTITAPIDGVVSMKPVEVGELVGPQTPAVVQLTDFDSLMIETDVPEGRLGLIQKDGPAEIVLDAYPTKRHRGKVAEISPRVNRAKATVIVKVKFADPTEGVLPDMSARVSFLKGELDAEAVKEPPKLFVPGSALVEQGGEKFVYRIDDGKAKRERVVTGAVMSGGFELTEGPAEGTRVIANPPGSISDGYPVKERKD